jgi:cholinesterase
MLSSRRHGSEIGLIFGTADLKGKGEDTPNQKKLGKAMREAWTGFAKDPVHGLHKLGWPIYDISSEFSQSKTLRLQ